MNNLRQHLIGVTLVVCGLALSTAQATPNDILRKRVAFLTNQLVHLPARRSAPAHVSQLVLKLSQLAPQYANSYFRWGISKLPYREYNDNQTQMANKTISIVNASILLGKKKSQIIVQIQYAVKRSAVPPPYQA